MNNSPEWTERRYSPIGIVTSTSVAPSSPRVSTAARTARSTSTST
nr:hypothetical protein [Actinoalloteichus sp. GBA129-24]